MRDSKIISIVRASRRRPRSRLDPGFIRCFDYDRLPHFSPDLEVRTCFHNVEYSIFLFMILMFFDGKSCFPQITCVSSLIYNVASSVASPRHQIREQYCFLDLPGDRQKCSGLLTTDLQHKPLDSELRLVRKGGSRISGHRALLITRCAIASGRAIDLHVEDTETLAEIPS